MEKHFRVPVDDSKVFIKIMDSFNASYKTDFTIESTDFLDGVEFVFIKYEKASLDEVYLLGYYCGGSYMRNGWLR